MGTEVLRPQDCLIQRIRVGPAVYHRRKNYNGYGTGAPKLSNAYRKPVIRTELPDQRKRLPEQRKRSPEQRKRSPEPRISKRSASVGDLRSKNNSSSSRNNIKSISLVSENVTILRRGESLENIMTVKQKNSDEEMKLYGTERLGPEPFVVPKQVRLGLPDVYAGSAISMSPSPRSLPLPSFFNKRESEKRADDSATRDLRRLLRLD